MANCKGNRTCSHCCVFNGKKMNSCHFLLWQLSNLLFCYLSFFTWAFIVISWYLLAVPPCKVDSSCFLSLLSYLSSSFLSCIIHIPVPPSLPSVPFSPSFLLSFPPSHACTIPRNQQADLSLLYRNISSLFC